VKVKTKKRKEMKKFIISSLLTGSYLFAQVNAPEVIRENDFETAEYQLFITNTKNIELSNDMTSKIVFEGEIDDYYKNYSEVTQKKFSLSEEVAKRTVHDLDKVANATFYKDIKSLENFGIATVGSIALNAMLGGILGDDTYVQVSDYYKDGKPVTRVIKYLVSDDGLDEEEYKMVFNTTNNQSYHFRSGGFQSVKFK